MVNKNKIAIIFMILSGSNLLHAAPVEIKPEDLSCKEDYDCLRITQDCCENSKVVAVARKSFVKLSKEQTKICFEESRAANKKWREDSKAKRVKKPRCKRLGYSGHKDLKCVTGICTLAN